MMPQYSSLFESPTTRLRPGSNVQLNGYGGNYTFSARPVQAVEEVANETTVTTHPFKCPASTDGSTASSIEPGTVNGVSATGLSLTISNSGTKYVYLDVSYTQDLTSNNYVIGFSGAITCAVATGSSVPSDTSTHLYRQIATYVNGVKTTQDITTSMEVVIRDDGNGASTSTAIWGTS